MDTGTLVLTLGAIISIVGIVWRTAIKPVWLISKNTVKVYESLEHYLPKLIKIANELEPNGGNSIKDILNRIDKNTQGSISRIWSLLETAKIGYYEADSEGKTVRVNKKWLELANISGDSYKDHGWINGIAVKDRDKVAQDWKSAIAEKRNFSSIYTMSSNVLVHGEASPIKTDNGEILGWIGYVEPIEVGVI